MTGPEAAAFVEREIEALFAAARDAVDDEIGPYALLTMPDGSDYRATYVVFGGGYIRHEGASPRYVENVGDEIELLLESIKIRFPNSSSQRLIWRKRPVFEIIPAQKASRTYQIEARPAAQQIYCRLVGVPLEAEFVGKWREPRSS